MTIEQKAVKAIQILNGFTQSLREPLPVQSVLFETYINWLKGNDDSGINGMKQDTRALLIPAITSAFGITELELMARVNGVNGYGVHQGLIDREVELEKKIRPGGWLENYIAYTRRVEVAMLYGIYSSLCIVGSALRRRVYLNRGAYHVHPNYCVLLSGPPSLRKSTAADYVKEIIKEEGLCPILPDSMTPESLVQELSEKGGCQFLFAPEFSVFVGRQQYKEGLAPLMLRLLDSPSSYVVKNKNSPAVTLTNVALNIIGATTPELISKATPAEVAGSGFLSRFLIVGIRSSARCFSRPSMDLAAKERLRLQLQPLKAMEGIVRFSEEAEEWYAVWYANYKKELYAEDDTVFAEIRARDSVHVERTAMLLHLVDHGTFQVCRSCVEQAAALIAECHAGTRYVADKISENSQAETEDRVLRHLNRNNGFMDHRTLLSACKIPATSFASHIRTLVETGKVTVRNNAFGRVYVATGMKEEE